MKRLHKKHPYFDEAVSDADVRKPSNDLSNEDLRGIRLPLISACYAEKFAWKHRLKSEEQINLQHRLIWQS
jgi:hypothetical protein